MKISRNANKYGGKSFQKHKSKNPTQVEEYHDIVPINNNDEGSVDKDLSNNTAESRTSQSNGIINQSLLNVSNTSI